jgi:hypothetical protein
MQNENIDCAKNFEKLQHLSITQIDQRLSSLIQTERITLSSVLHHLQELDRRRNYLGYPSLFEYLVDRHKYSHGMAQRRIDAARLGREIPSVISDLENGSLNQAQISLVQKSIRRSQRKISSDDKSALLRSLKHRSLQQSEFIINKTLQIESKKEAKVIHQADGSVRLEVSLSQDQWNKVQQMRDLISHSLPHGSAWDQALEYVANRVIQSKTKSKTKSGTLTPSALRKKEIVELQPEPTPTTPTTPTTPPAPRASPSISVLRKKILTRDQKCQARNSHTGRICGSTWRLQVDHIQPRWANGQDEDSNLQALCAFHNRQKYEREAGIRRI